MCKPSEQRNSEMDNLQREEDAKIKNMLREAAKEIRRWNVPDEGRLLKAGVKIYEYQPCFLHLKMVLVDDWVSIGSCNFDHWNLRFNLEANLEALDPSLTAAVAASFEKDFGLSQQVSLEEWRKRPLWRRVKQRVWGWVDRVVVNLLDRRG